MQDLKEFLVGAFCMASMLVAMLKLLTAEVSDLMERWRRKR